MNETIKLEISGKNKSDCFLVEHNIKNNLATLSQNNK